MWGNGIIGAVKMEEMGIPGRVHISDATARLIGEEFSLSVAHEEMDPSFVASYAIAKSFVVEQRPSVSMNDDDLKQLTAEAAVEKALERSEEAASGHTRRGNQANKDSAGGGGKLKRTGTGTLSMIKRKLSSTAECPGRRSSSVRRRTAATSHYMPITYGCRPCYIRLQVRLEDDFMRLCSLLITPRCGTCTCASRTTSSPTSPSASASPSSTSPCARRVRVRGSGSGSG